MPKRLFVAATRQNEGKTTTSLGLIAALLKRGLKVGFIKPVGQRHVKHEGMKVDEDALLVEQVCGVDCRLGDMSPVAVERDFTRKYIDGQADQRGLRSRIVDSYSRVAVDKDVVVIEGTGHAGVGSVFGLSNAVVAKTLDAKAIVISSGGIGRPLDEIMLNHCLFKTEGVPVIGAIINRCLREKLDQVKDYCSRSLESNGMKLLGAIPVADRLSTPTIAQVMEEIGGELINGEEFLESPIERVVIGAMSAHNALNHFGGNVLAVTPGDREDLILAAMSSCVVGVSKAYCVAGLVLTGGLRPHQTIMRLIRRTTIPVIAVESDSYSTASTIHDIMVKIRPNDERKIELARRLVERHVDVDAILAAF